MIIIKDSIHCGFHKFESGADFLNYIMYDCVSLAEMVNPKGWKVKVLGFDTSKIQIIHKVITPLELKHPCYLVGMFNMKDVVCCADNTFCPKQDAILYRGQYFQSQEEVEQYKNRLKQYEQC